MTWNYRVVRRKCSEKVTPFQYIYGIHEAYYDADGGCCAITAEPVAAIGESVEELNGVLIMMKMDARKRPVLDYETREPIARAAVREMAGMGIAARAPMPDDAPDAPAARELAVDELLRNFQSACENYMVSDQPSAAKHRAILRNALRKQLLDAAAAEARAVRAEDDALRLAFMATADWGEIALECARRKTGPEGDLDTLRTAIDACR